jgi:NADH-quinone oxidoreductase subunit L
MDFHEHPGQLYVVATLLPLASFLILLLAGGLRNAVRCCDSGIGRSIYGWMGVDKPQKTGAYIATAAIGGAFVLCLIGFIWHGIEAHGEHHGPGHSHSHNEATEEEEGHGETFRTANPRWSGSVVWAQLGSQKNDPQRGTTLELGYHIDHLSSIMFLMVTFIATLIHLFSIGYMSEELDPIVADHHVHTEDGHLHRRGRFGRFFMYLSLFCFSMLNLILANNLFQIFVSWELVGICSYLLIGFYFERQSASNAANKAFITNRIGDAGFIIGLLVLWTYIGSFNFEDIFGRLRAPLKDSHGHTVDMAGHIIRGNIVSEEGRLQTVEIDMANGSEVVLLPPHIHSGELKPESKDKRTGVVGPTRLVTSKNPEKDGTGTMPYWLLVVAGLGIFLGCVGKSAQFPLHVWLPDAMEGPTPVSALIHAATMVAAGVYLVGRVYPIFTPESRLVIAYVGGITLFVAATVAIIMTDIKKVLAYSTVSQLGYMMLALGVGGWVAGLFHLLTHAFFKALLFLGSGSVIYGCHHEQEMTKMGGLFKKMPITALTMLAGVLAIGGVPLFSGWYSKDAIIAHAYGFASIYPQHILLLLLPLVTAGITAFYMFRMWFMTFTGEPRDAHVHEHAHESPWLMTIPLILLGICSICVAWGWPVWDAEASAMEHHVHHSQHHAVVRDLGAMIDDTLLPSLSGQTVRGAAQANHGLAGLLALGVAALGFVFAYIVYYQKKLDPADAAAQFPGVYRFLQHKWYFDEAYSVLLVRPAMVVAGWCRWFDATIIDGFINNTAKGTVQVAKWDGQFDSGVIDGLANLFAKVAYGVGGWLRTWQTGFLRSYVLFLVLAAIALYVALAYFVNLATAG